jgi:hypothetical protein
MSGGDPQIWQYGLMRMLDERHGVAVCEWSRLEPPRTAGS